MPCILVSSDAVALGLVTAVQSGFGVWGRLAEFGDIWGRWDLVGPGSPDVSPNGGTALAYHGTPEPPTRPRPDRLAAEREATAGILQALQDWLLR